MVHKILATLAVVSLAWARTPDGFGPATTTDLIVEYRGFVPLNGVDISRSGKHALPYRRWQAYDIAY